MGNRTVIRALSYAVVVGAALFVVGTIVAGLAYPGYDHVDQMISELGGVDAPNPLIQNVTFLVFGATIVGLAVALMLDAGTVFLGAILLAGLGVFGTAMEGVVHCDSGCLGQTTEGSIHLASGLFGFVCGVAAMFVLGRRWRRDPRWTAHVLFTRICAWAALAGLVVFFVSNGFPSVDGLAQRLFVLPLVVFCAGTGLRLASLPAVAEAAEARPAAATS